MKNLSTFLFSLPLMFVASCRDQIPEDTSSPPDPSSHHSTSSLSTQLSEHSSGNNRTIRANQLPTDALANLEKTLSSASLLDADYLGNHIRDLMLKHPEQAAALVDTFTAWLFEQDPKSGIQFVLKHHHYVPGLNTDGLATRLLNQWKESDQAALETHLHKLAEHGGGTEFECHRTLKLLMASGRILPRQMAQLVESTFKRKRQSR